MTDDFDSPADIRRDARIAAIDQRARDSALVAANAIRQHEAVCMERDKNAANLFRAMQDTLEEIRHEVREQRTENDAKHAQQQNINSELFVKLSKADTWRGDQTLFRCSLAANGAFFTAVLMLGLKLSGHF